MCQNTDQGKKKHRPGKKTRTNNENSKNVQKKEEENADKKENEFAFFGMPGHRPRPRPLE